MTPEWLEAASCRGVPTSVFFPARATGVARAKAICAKCPVRRPCWEYGQSTDSEGIWGGVLRSKGGLNEYDEKEPNVIPQSLSATSIQNYLECPAGWRAAYLNRAPDMSGAAASLGTSCHTALEAWVVDGHYLKDYTVQQAQDAMRALYSEAYWREFSVPDKFDEGLKLVFDWLARQDWSNRKVLTVELKRRFNLKTSVGEIPLSYIFDREDELDNGDIEIIDYKSLSAPLSPEKLKQKPQARIYGLAAQLLHPDANRIWVTFDMLRYEPIGICFTKEDNRATWKFLHQTAERIIADDQAREVLGPGCRWCIRQLECESLKKHADAGGILGIKDPIAAAQRKYEIDSQIAGLKGLSDDLETLVLDWLKENNSTELEGVTNSEGDPLEVNVGLSGRRAIDPERLRTIVGDKLAAGLGKPSIKEVDALLKSDDLTAEQKSLVRQSIRKNYGDPSIKIAKASVI